MFLGNVTQNTWVFCPDHVTDFDQWMLGEDFAGAALDQRNCTLTSIDIALINLGQCPAKLRKLTDLPSRQKRRDLCCVRRRGKY